MKKLVVTVFAIVLMMPAPAEGFFNRDCSNLQKRVSANQKKYEKAWDKYQNVLAKWINAGAKWQGQGIVISRIDQVGNIQVKIIDDLIKNRKCLTDTNPSTYASQRTEVTYAMRGARNVILQFDYPFRQIVDYTKYIKK